MYSLSGHRPVQNAVVRTLAGFFHLRFLADKAIVRAIGFSKDQPPSAAMNVHSFERNFATGEIAITTPVDTNTGEIPPALLADDIGKPGELHHLCGE